MENIRKKPDNPGERRWAKRSDVSLQMQIWPELEERGNASSAVKTRDVSLCGIYFVSEAMAIENLPARGMKEGEKSAMARRK